MVGSRMGKDSGGPERAALTSARHAAIFDAVFQLLGELGYDRMSMDAVAARAHASKATIYRAWPNKPDLVIDAFTYRFAGLSDVPDTGSLRGDLIALMEGACRIANGPEGAVVGGIMSAATRNVGLAQALHRCTYEMKQGIYESLITRAVERGEIREGSKSALLHEVLHSLVLARKMWAVEPLDDEFVVHVVDDVLVPILVAGRLSSASESSEPDLSEGHLVLE